MHDTRHDGIPFPRQDPTTANRQENDRGTQYASAIFTHTPKQAEVATRVTAQLQALVGAGKIPKFATREVTTAIRPAAAFFAAHEEHQRYLEDNPAGYCEFSFYGMIVFLPGTPSRTLGRCLQAITASALRGRKSPKICSGRDDRS